MADQQPEKDIPGKSVEGFHKRLKEAELYLQQGLLNEAGQILASLRARLKDVLDADEQTRKLPPSVRHRLQSGVSSLENRLKEIDQKEAAFMDGAGGPVKKVEATLTAEDMVRRGVLLRNLGFFDEAVDEFRRAAAMRADLVADCYAHMGLALIGKGDLERGVGLLRQAIALEKDQAGKNVRILEQIAEAYEIAGEKQKAVGAYREIIFLDAHCGRALEKIEQLSAELKRIPLNLSLVCRYPKRFLAASILFALVFVVFNPFVKTVNNVDYFTLDNDPDIRFYESFKTVFGNDEFFVIAVKCDDFFSAERLVMLQQITEQLDALEDVDEVTSLANVNDIIGGEDFFEVRKFLDDIPEEKEALDRLRIAAIGNALYRKNLISENGNTAAILVVPFDKPDDEDFRKRLLAQTDAVLAPYKARGVSFHVGGWTVTNFSLGHYLNADTMVFIPATYLLITLATWLFFRNWRLVLLAVVNISLCVGATRGLMGMAGITLNNVTVIIVPLVMALALCDTVHIFSHMDRGLLKRFPDEKQALAHVLNSVGLPCFLTTVTTAIGFLSLFISEIPPIKQFAWVASAGMVFEFLFSFFFLPPLILLFHPEKLYLSNDAGERMPLFLRALFRFVNRYGRWVIACCLVITLISCYATSRLRVETNLLEFFKKSSPVRTALDFVETHLAGVGAVDVSFKAKMPEAFKEPDNLRVIETVQEFVSGLNGVDKTISFVDFLKDMNQSFHAEDTAFYQIPESSELVSQYLLLYDSDDLEDFVSADYSHARLSIRISLHSSAQQKNLIDRINGFLEKVDAGDLTIRVTGQAVKDVNVIDALVSSQVSSLSIAALVISIIMFVVFRSVSLASLSMIPNLFPIILNFGIMGLFGIPLDTGTALIAAVALGIAVDDTIHFLTEYQRHRVQGLRLADSLEAVIQRKGRAMISSSLILALGFGVLVLSRFMPVVHFGLLCAIIMVTAVIGDLLLLPAVILMKKNK